MWIADEQAAAPGSFGVLIDDSNIHPSLYISIHWQE